MPESERSSMIVAQGGCIEFVVSSSVSRPQSIRGDWCGKPRPNFAFFTLCKI